MNKDRIFWGCCLLLVAVLMLTNQIWGTFDIGLFKAIVTVFAAAFIIRSIPEVSFWGILIPVALVVTMYKGDMGLEISSGVIWGSAILASAGLELIFKDAKKKLKNNKVQNKNIAMANISNVTGEHIRINNSFGSTTKYVNSDAFLSGRIENSFGSITVYLNNAIIQNGRADVRIENAFGEMNIYVPRDWKVNNSIRSFLGAANDNTNNFNTDYPVLYIAGENSFGSVNIFSI